MFVLHRVSVAGLLAFAAVQLVACRNDDRPVTDAIQYDSTVCAGCGALIHDSRFAAQAVQSDGTVEAFDDPGCLFRAFADKDLRRVRVFFHDHESHGWLGAAECWFARTEGIRSPQGYDWAAYGSFAAAQDAVTTAAGTGEILPFEKMPQRLAQSVPPVPADDREP